jgi:hypothetical protein
MKQYKVILTGETPLIFHRDNLAYAEKIGEWCKDPANKANSKPGDDRSPAWTWLGYVYDDGEVMSLDSDNIMTMLREGGAKVPTGKRSETYKKQSQSGLVLDDFAWPLLVDGETVSIKDVKSLYGEMEFIDHIRCAEDHGFELFVKRVKIGSAKHVRVRPLFRKWSSNGTITVLDEEMSGITKDVLQKILDMAGSQCGLCDWRPSSPRASGPYGRFTATVKLARLGVDGRGAARRGKERGGAGLGEAGQGEAGNMAGPGLAW